MAIPEDYCLESYGYEIPEEKIAKYPTNVRSNSKLLIIDRQSGEIIDSKFSKLISYLNSGDVVVLNNTRVIPARIKGNKSDTSAVIEVLLLEEISDSVWKCLSRPGKRLKCGSVIIFTDDFAGEVLEKLPDGTVIIKFNTLSRSTLFQQLEKSGEVPIPPYLKRDYEALDKHRYQTVYAKKSGAVAAPTAGLHFETGQLEQLTEKGIEILYVTLHTGYGTFKPIEVSDIREHPIHSEEYEINEETVEKLRNYSAKGRRIIPVGTTSMRMIEYLMKIGDEFQVQGKCDLFIYPGFQFRISKSLITNFHLPYSSLLVLVSAFAGRNLIMRAYSHALENNYRFFSYGDSMLII